MHPMTKDAGTNKVDAINAAMTALKPLATLLIESGVSYRDVERLFRRTYVDQAADRHRSLGIRPSISRLAAITGLTRQDVSETLSTPPTLPSHAELSPRAQDRILAGWHMDPDFLNPDGSPRPLEYSSNNLSFSDLVKRHGPDIPPRALLNEMITAGQVKRLAGSQHVPVTEKQQKKLSSDEAIGALGSKLNAYGSTLLANLYADESNQIFEYLGVNKSVDQGISSKLTRDLEKRCSNFSASIDRLLIDSSYNGKQVSEEPTNAQCEIGVIVAVIRKPA